MIDWILLHLEHEQNLLMISRQSGHEREVCAQKWSLFPVDTAFHSPLCRSTLCSLSLHDWWEMKKNRVEQRQFNFKTVKVVSLKLILQWKWVIASDVSTPLEVTFRRKWIKEFLEYEWLNFTWLSWTVWAHLHLVCISFDCRLQPSELVSMVPQNQGL